MDFGIVRIVGTIYSVGSFQRLKLALNGIQIAAPLRDDMDGRFHK